ncbi:SPIDR protein, partial [Fregetta grallaria]|nr:SPIDR protein [Fregetta grallaria]
WNGECTPFPDETPLQLKKSNFRTSVAATSISNAWLRCGDGFQSTSVPESLRSTDKKSRIKKHLGPLLTSAESAAGIVGKFHEEANDLDYSSIAKCRRYCHSSTDLYRCLERSAGASFLKIPFTNIFVLDESEFIDWEKDSDSTDRCDGSEKDDSSLEISDSDSCANLNSLPVKEEDDELCKVRNCFRFKKNQKKQ